MSEGPSVQASHTTGEDVKHDDQTSSTPSSLPTTSTSAQLLPPTTQPITLHHPSPTKPRSNSQLHSSRPAPPSPAPSRPNSQLLSSSPIISRDRSYSTTSSSGTSGSNLGTRRTSTSGRSSKPRPRSSLGNNAFTIDNTDSPDPSEDPPSSSSFTNTPIPEDTTPPTPPQPSTSLSPPKHTLSQLQPLTIIIRDYAFPPSDLRYNGPPPLPPSTISTPSSPNTASSSSKKASNTWSGFNLLSFRGFLSRRPSQSQSQSNASPPTSDEEENYALPEGTTAEPDDYAFSSDGEEGEREGGQGEGEGEGEEPWGVYRAVFGFESMGEHELNLEEGDLLDVRGRGGGDGWVVAVRYYPGGVGGRGEDGERENKEGLVPESYLEKVHVGGVGVGLGKEDDRESGGIRKEGDSSAKGV